MPCPSRPADARRRALLACGAVGASSLAGARLAAAAETPPPPPKGAGCLLIPMETAGPFPLLAVLADRRFVRRDITEGQPGLPLDLVIEVVDVARACAPVAGAAVYIWHCNRDGAYSGYRLGPLGDHSGATWLRGVQPTDGAGRAQFRTIYPGWYPGRVTHIHFQVYLGGPQRGRATATSQLAFPDEANAAVYATPAYAGRSTRGQVLRNADDGLFNDGYADQLVSLRGDPASGYAAFLRVGVNG